VLVDGYALEEVCIPDSDASACAWWPVLNDSSLPKLRFGMSRLLVLGAAPCGDAG